MVPGSSSAMFGEEEFHDGSSDRGGNGPSELTLRPVDGYGDDDLWALGGCEADEPRFGDIRSVRADRGGSGLPRDADAAEVSGLPGALLDNLAHHLRDHLGRRRRHHLAEDGRLDLEHGLAV